MNLQEPKKTFKIFHQSLKNVQEPKITYKNLQEPERTVNNLQYASRTLNNLQEEPLVTFKNC